ncbi:MAG: PilZ domain-containing protein [Hyphomonas sp.]|nr:PilZ domain-containing protein [Hyphomonas sp.]
MRPPPQPSNRQFSRHASVRRARLKPAGQSRWIEVALTDWSTAGAGLRGAPDSLSPGPAIVEIDDRHGERGIRMACEIVWQERGRFGLRFSGPVLS